METIKSAEFFNEEGYLINFDHWTPDMAIELAKEDDLLLNDDHWLIIRFLREYYEEYQIAPAIKTLTRYLFKKLGSVQRSTVEYIYKLFPYGPSKQACKYAGLPKPTGCL